MERVPIAYSFGHSCLSSLRLAELHRPPSLVRDTILLPSCSTTFKLQPPIIPEPSVIPRSPPIIPPPATVMSLIASVFAVSILPIPAIPIPITIPPLMPSIAIIPPPLLPLPPPSLVPSLAPTTAPPKLIIPFILPPASARGTRAPQTLVLAPGAAGATLRARAGRAGRRPAAESFVHAVKPVSAPVGGDGGFTDGGLAAAALGGRRWAGAAFEFAAAGYEDRGVRAVVPVHGQGGDLFEHRGAGDQAPEDGVFAVQVEAGLEGDEELAGVGVAAAIGHAD